VLELLSVVVRAFNKACVLPEFHRRMTEAMQAPDLNYEIIYVDDGSADETVAVWNNFQERDESVAVIELSRYFGREVAISVGLDHSQRRIRLAYATH